MNLDVDPLATIKSAETAALAYSLTATSWGPVSQNHPAKKSLLIADPQKYR